MREKEKQGDVHKSVCFFLCIRENRVLSSWEKLPPHSMYLNAGFVPFHFHMSHAFLHSYYTPASCFMFLILALQSQFATYGLLGVDLQLLT